jgi:gas vesicle protein GvpN
MDRVVAEPSDAFVTTPRVRDLTRRALTYLEVGYSVHLSGPSGTGKTTLAFHVAAKRGRPIMLMNGDDEFKSSDLVGKESGVRRSRVVDNYIHSVLRTEEEAKSVWLDNRLTTACESGFTLIYDEFTRSRAEANNPLLSILSERILNLPRLRSTPGGYLAVHPEFRAILTSNPEEYAGTHKTQDALMDRLVTVRLDHYDRDTEVEITVAKSGLEREDAERIVDVVRTLRDIGVNNHRPTVRACITIARTLAHCGGRPVPGDETFAWVTQDVLVSADTLKVTRRGQSLMAEKLDEAIRKICGKA